MWWIFAVVLLLLVLLVGRKQKQENNPDAQNIERDHTLEHTIRVNVRILSGELDELETLAEKSTKTEAVQEAQALLSSARQAANYALQSLALHESTSTYAETENNESLGKLLSIVFRAMDKSCRARHLLGAVRTDLII